MLRPVLDYTQSAGLPDRIEQNRPLAAPCYGHFSTRAVPSVRARQVTFSFYHDKQLVADFKGGQISSDAGLLLLRELEEREAGSGRRRGECK
jgi:hypothetical protein